MLQRACLAVLLLALCRAPLIGNAAFEGQLSGIIVDGVNGGPIRNAMVTLAPVENLDEVQNFLTSADGRFVFSGLKAGKYRLTAARTGYVQQGLDQHEGYMTAVAVGPERDSEHIQFRLFPGGAVAGQVMNEWSDPVMQADALLFEETYSDGLRKMKVVSRTKQTMRAAIDLRICGEALMQSPWWQDPGMPKHCPC